MTGGFWLSASWLWTLISPLTFRLCKQNPRKQKKVESFPLPSNNQFLRASSLVLLALNVRTEVFGAWGLINKRSVLGMGSYIASSSLYFKTRSWDWSTVAISDSPFPFILLWLILILQGMTASLITSQQWIGKHFSGFESFDVTKVPALVAIKIDSRCSKDPASEA